MRDGTIMDVTLILRDGDKEIDRQSAKMDEHGVLVEKVTFNLDKVGGIAEDRLNVVCEDAFGRLVPIERSR